MSQVILFDLDGTLTESGEGIIKSVEYALEKLGVTENDPENLKRYVGPPLKESFMKFSGLNEEQAEQGIGYYRERYTKVGMFENRLYPQIPELLEVLKINDKILGVASSKPEIFVNQILEHFGIAQYFQVIVGSELDGRRSKKEEVIEEALLRLHMQTERDKVLMVGDKEQDVNGARSCGLQCIGVAYGYGTREELSQAGAVYIADTVEDLGILASPNDEETTEHVESVRKNSKNRWERKGVSRRKKEEKQNRTKADEKAEHQWGEDAIKESDSGSNRPIHPVMQIWRLIYPILIHLGISMAVSIAFSMFFIWKVISGTDLSNNYDVVEKINSSTLYQLILTSVLSGVITFFLYRKDQQRRKAGFLGQGEDFVWSPPVIWFSVIILAIAGSQMLNDLILVFRLNEIFPYYSQMTDDTMTGQPVWLLFLTVGLLAPAAEELIFRGLVFRRMKDFMNPWAAIILSALLFGIYHGNMIQFLYASLMGILLAVIYHRTGTLWTSILAHVVANLWSLFGNSWWSSMWAKIPFGFILGFVIELLLCVIPVYWIFADRRKSNRKRN
ncbi:MAG: HAD hydrolase-like protein [Oliverpabstia sp.]|nr:HAD hydrolase-like protein [Oliverpabstia sp.]